MNSGFTNSEEFKLDYGEFVAARRLFRSPPQGRNIALGTERGDFMLYSVGPQPIVAVFEEAEQAGWFYLFEAQQKQVLKGAHIYDRAHVAVEDDVVDIGWAADDSACGLALWGQFRAFLGISTSLAIHKLVTNADDEGIPSSQWPAGFDHYLEKKFD